MDRSELRELTTLSGIALGGIVGGVLVSPLGPWGAVGGSTLGATVGAWVTSTIWREYYLDLRGQMEEVKRLLERERWPEAVELIGRIRAHPRYDQQEHHARAELEDALGRITLQLARAADAERDAHRALDFYRRARQMRPADAEVLWRIVRLKTEAADPGYEEGGHLASDLDELLRLDPRHAEAWRALVELHDRRGHGAEAEAALRRAASALEGDEPALARVLGDLHGRAPGDGAVTVRLLNCLLELGEVGRAAAVVDRAVAAGEPLRGDPAWEAVKGELLLAKGDLLGAEEPLRRAVDAAGLLPRANLALGRVLMGRRAWLEAAEALAPLVAHPRWLREALVPLVESLIRAGRYEEAELHLEREAFRELPEYPSKLRELAQALEDKGQQDRARRLWSRLGDVAEAPPFWRRFAIVYRGQNPVLLGAGRMGRVYLGRRRDDGALVAVREIPFVCLHDTSRLTRFRRDVELLATLDHPNVARLQGHALLEGKCLMALEYCSRGSLRDLVGEPLVWSEARRIALGVLEGLAYLHGRSPALVHRNLKPSNVLLAADGTPKLADFALARLLESPTTSVITSVQEQAAAYLYASPEVILGASDVSPAADLYSFGCILFELLTGSPPFARPDVDEQLRAHLTGTPEPPSARAAWIPAALDALVLELLRKAPADRPTGAEAVARRLAGL